MEWIWQTKGFPNFEFDPLLLMNFEQEYHKNSGIIVGKLSHLEAESIEALKIEILVQEAVATSNIEGEILERASVQSSIRKHFGLKTDGRKAKEKEEGIAKIMIDVYLNFDKTLTHQILFQWHKMLMQERNGIETIGDYRLHPEPMQIISGNLATPKLFYEAPPSWQVQELMDDFLIWYNKQSETQNSLSTLVIAGITHLYFEVIHPFEDGNGRIGRALVEKMVSQQLAAPALNSFARIIDARKKDYYDALQSCNHGLKIDKWLIFFAKAMLDAQQYSIKLIDFLIAKSKFFEKHNLNDRQTKALLRVFEEGLEGFKGGLSANNYQKITGASPATATRDLQELVNMNALSKTGELKYTRYSLVI